ncbi:MAG: hypothetical protein PHV32_14955 [Eubacteriales bacterium]|nr:hypothetical protein [Eubacteriales bacterium]
MRIIVVSRFRKKLLYFLIFASIWILTTYAAGILFNSIMVNDLTIENVISFSSPAEVRVISIFALRHTEDAIETSMALSRYSCMKFNSYESLSGKIAFDYPANFILTPQVIPGNEILYHIDFKDDSNTYRGFIQVWNLNMPLKQFLEGSLKTSTISFIDFKSGNTILDSMPGYIWEYSLKGNDGILYKGMEIFAQDGQKMYRISYFVPLEKWDKKAASIFWKIVKSFKVLQPPNS